MLSSTPAPVEKTGGMSVKLVLHSKIGTRLRAGHNGLLLNTETKGQDHGGGVKRLGLLSDIS